MSRLGVLAGVVLSSASLPAFASCGPSDWEIKEQRLYQKELKDRAVLEEQGVTLAEALADSRAHLKLEGEYQAENNAGPEVTTRYTDFQILLNAISQRAANVVYVGRRDTPYPQLSYSHLREDFISQLEIFGRQILDDVRKAKDQELKRELVDAFALTLTVRRLIEAGDLHCEYVRGGVLKPNTTAPLSRLESKCQVLRVLGVQQRDN